MEKRFTEENLKRYNIENTHTKIELQNKLCKKS